MAVVYRGHHVSYRLCIRIPSDSSHVYRLVTTWDYLSMNPKQSDMFPAYAPEFRCFVPGCDMENETSIDQSILDFALPKEYSSTEIFILFI